MQAINIQLRATLQILEKFQVIHLCGNGNIDNEFNNLLGYVQFEYINEELSNLFAAADIVVSRAGANAICELLALRKPTVLIPLPLGASRGDQILNAQSFERQGFSFCQRGRVNPSTLLNAIKKVYINKEMYLDNMNKSEQVTR